jgi:hypothetical protein
MLSMRVFLQYSTKIPPISLERENASDIHPMWGFLQYSPNGGIPPISRQYEDSSNILNAKFLSYFER